MSEKPSNQFCRWGKFYGGVIYLLFPSGTLHTYQITLLGDGSTRI